MSKKSMKLIVLVSMLFFIFALLGCGQQATEKQTTEKKTSQNPVLIVVPKVPASLPILKMVEDKKFGDHAKLEYFKQSTELVARIKRNDYSFIAIPVNRAANFYNKGEKIKFLNMMIYGTFALVTTDPSVKSWNDLKGKTIASPSKGSTPNVFLEYYLSKHNLIPGKDVNIVYSTHGAISQMIRAGKVDCAIEAEPFLEVNQKKVKNYHVITDFYQEYKNLHGKDSYLPNMGFFVNEQFAKEHPEIMKDFQQNLKLAQEWVANHPKEAALLSEKYINSKVEVVEPAIPAFHFTYLPQEEARKNMETYYNILMQFMPENIGNKIPDNNFYY